MKYQILLAMASIGGLSSTLALAADSPNACPARHRARQLSYLFAEGGICAKLPEGSRAAIRGYSDAATLSSFRGIKKTWLKEFDSNEPGSLGLLLRTATQTAGKGYVPPPPANTPEGKVFWDRTHKIEALFSAIDKLRPDGGTTPEHVRAILDAITAIPTQAFNDWTIDKIHRAYLGMSNIKMILMCRLGDRERAKKVLEANQKCDDDGSTYPSPASDYLMFVGPIVFPAAEPVAGTATVSQATSNQN